MQGPIFLLVSFSLLYSTVTCHPYLPNNVSVFEILEFEAIDEIKNQVAELNGTNVAYSSDDYGSNGSGNGVKVGVPVGGILAFIGLCWLIRRCCCQRNKTQNVIAMQQTTNIQPQQAPAAAAPQIIIQQPIINQQTAPTQAPPQWGQPPQGPHWGPPPQGPQWGQPPQGGQWGQPPQGVQFTMGH